MSTPKLGRKADHRDSTLRNLLTSLVLYEKVVTTDAKARAVVARAERLITFARRGDLAARRYAKAHLFDDNAVRKLFEDMPARFGDRTSGFIRRTKLGFRPGDGSEKVQLEIMLTPLETIIEQETNVKTKVRKAPKAVAATTEEAAA